MLRTSLLFDRSHRELSSGLAHGPASAVEEQVTNGVAVRMALLYGLATASQEGA